MNTNLLSERGTVQPTAIASGAGITLSGGGDRGFRTPDADAWGRLWSQLKVIEARHRLADDAETPRLPDAVIQGTRRLIRYLEDARDLEDARETPPTLMTGTCDATVTLEWHAPGGPGSFRSLDVLAEDTAEEFVITAAGVKSLSTVAF